MYRRTLVKLAMTAAGAVPFLRLRLEAALTELPPDRIGTLKDLAAVVLPASLGRRATDALAIDFAAWVRGYRAGVAMEHGYGNPRVRVTPPSPAAAYVEQLEALEAGARARGAAFGRLPAAERRALVEAAFEKAGIDRLPRRPSGRHVAADLMAFYFESSDANDYAYRAAIGRQQCRPVEVSTKKPPRLRAD